MDAGLIDAGLQWSAAAFHEAAHAVVALEFGWEINDEGIEIDGRQRTGLRYRLFDWRADDAIAVSLGGHIAEWRHVGRPLPTRVVDSDLRALIDAERSGWAGEYSGEECETDDEAVIRLLIKGHGARTDEQIIEFYRRHEARTAKLLRRRTIWRAVERVAAALVERGKLSAQEVYALVDGEE